MLRVGGGNEEGTTGWVDGVVFVLAMKRNRDVESKVVFFICCMSLVFFCH